jgi:hypothetical protein
MKSGFTQSLVSTLSTAFSLFLLYPFVSLCVADDSLPKQSVSATSAKADTASPSSINGKTTVTPADTAVAKSPDQQTPKESNHSIDTILVLTNKTIKNFMKNFTTKYRGSRGRGYGGCIGFSPGVYGIVMAPIRSLVERVGTLKSIGFNLSDDYKMMNLPGGLLYGGLGNGMRIGLEGRGGSASYWKEKVDTTFFLDISLGYGGLLLEKAFVTKDFNFIIGGLAGVGGMSVKSNHAVGTSGFNDNSNDNGKTDGSASAVIMIVQMHLGFTYSFLPWIHIGLETVLPAFISSGGFQGSSGRNITDGFTTLNFGAQLRLVLGNLG